MPGVSGAWRREPPPRSPLLVSVLPQPGRERKGSAGSAAPSVVCHVHETGGGEGGAELEEPWVQDPRTGTGTVFPHGVQMWHTAWRFASTSGLSLFGSLCVL